MVNLMLGIADQEPPKPSLKKTDDGKIETIYDKDILIEESESERYRDLGNDRSEKKQKVPFETKFHITHKMFKQYLFVQGVSQDHKKLIDDVFEACCERVATVPDKFKKNSQVNHKINLRVFLYNFKRWLGEKSKMKDLVSSKKAQDINNILRNYLKDYESIYPSFRLDQITHQSEKQKERLTQSRVSPHEFFLMSRRDFEIFNLDSLKMEHGVVESFLKHFDKHPFKLDT